jgi:uncharacterized membrane protein YraQ (UPF0718 family)
MKLFLAIWRVVLVAVISFCVGLIVQKEFLVLKDERKVSEEELQTTLKALTKQVERMSKSSTGDEKEDVQKTLETMIKNIGQKPQE